MNKKKKTLIAEEMPEFKASIDAMSADSKIFVDKSLEIAEYIFQVMEQKGLKQKDLAEKMGKTEAEVSKMLGGMHNLTLRSISKLEAALEATIVCTPPKDEVHIDINMFFGSLKDVMSKITKDKERQMNYGCKVVEMKQSKTEKLKEGAA